ncbi:MAG: hypothetical protein JO133_08785 [Burkholderiaceae bacterium]|nr:hypothetical protein [Burkholderiaceae bacterium]
MAFVDPLAALLLFSKPRVGIALTLAIIITDVVHNAWFLRRADSPFWTNWMFLAQLAFLLFVVLTTRSVWPVDRRGQA